jgi:hypothetical protein
MLVNAEDDLSRVRSSGNNDLGKDRLIKMSVDLGRFVIKNFKQEVSPKTEGLTTSIVDVARQAWNCIGVLARLHGIATAADDDIPMSGLDSIGSHRDCGRLLTEEASFLARKPFLSARRNDYRVFADLPRFVWHPLNTKHHTARQSHVLHRQLVLL